MNLVLPTVAALAGAGVYGASGVLQQRATHRVSADSASQVAFLRDLVRQPLWLLSTVGSVAGFILQGVALATGPIVLVQPLLVTGVLFAAATGFLLDRGPVDRLLVVGLLLTAGGLAVFLAASRPQPGQGALTLAQAVPLAVGLAVVLAGCLALALRHTGTARSLALALAAGIVYGVTAAVAKLTLHAIGEGVPALLQSWSLWAVVVLGPLGFLLNQHAFRAAALASPVVAVITVTDPLVGIGIGLLWLNESVRADPVSVTIELAGLATMVAGVWTVAHRAPHLTAGRDRAGSGSRPVVPAGHEDAPAATGPPERGHR